MSPAASVTTAATATKRIEVSRELKDLMRRLKLGKLLDTLPERLALAATQHLPHQDFLEMLFADEVTRRDRQATQLRARAAHLDPTMHLQAWDDTTQVSFDRTLWTELCSLRFILDSYNVLIMGPVGVGKTFLAHALGHVAIRRRCSVHAERADKLFKRLRAARLDHTHDDEIRKLHRIDLLILDDLALHPLDATDTSDFYELIVERHRQASTIITSNREPPEMLTMMADPLLAQSALDRLQSAAFELVIEGPSYRQRQKPTLAHLANTQHTTTTNIDDSTALHDDHNGSTTTEVVPCSWQTSGPITLASDTHGCVARRGLMCRWKPNEVSTVLPRSDGAAEF